MQLLRAWLAITAGKLAARLIVVLQLGNATTVPGRVALAFYPQLLSEHFSKQIQQQCGTQTIAITGTNGKTTTAGLLASMLQANGTRVLHNTLGANMLGGIASALVLAAKGNGYLQLDALVLEVDEASLRHITQALPIHQVVVTNLFRDQLDRYGELDTTARLIESGIAHCQPNPTLYLNGHDSRILAMAQTQSEATCHGFGLRIQPTLAMPQPALLETVPCRFETAAWEAPLQTPPDWPVTVLGNIQPTADGYLATLHAPSPSSAHEAQQMLLPVSGLFNVMNTSAALSVARHWGVPLETALTGIKQYKGVFGRSETLHIRGKRIQVLLIKNPVGATEVCRMVAAEPDARLLLALNDNDADGRDVSWIWDAGFEWLTENRHRIVCSGQRAADMALRLKYAGLPAGQLQLIESVTDALNAATEATPPGETLYALVTYTALLSLRPLLAEMSPTP